MTPEKILAVVEKYERQLRLNGIPKQRLDPRRTFESATKIEVLMHARHLCESVKNLAKEPDREGKTGRHLASLQMCLSFAGWYTLEELMQHNKS